MKRLIPLLMICLAVLCFFASCGMFETIPIEGTWTADFEREVGYNKTAYYTFKLVFSGDKAQIIKYQYGSSGHKNLVSTQATDLMTYTAGKSGVYTADHSTGIMIAPNAVETFTVDKSGDKLVWKMGYSGKEYTFAMESSTTAFITPSSENDTYERYNLNGFDGGHIRYYDTSKSSGIMADRPDLTLYSDGRYTIDFVNSGTWERSKDDPNKIILTPTNTMVFSKMELRFDAKWMLMEIYNVVTTNQNYEDEGDFKFNFSWYRDFYQYF
ncbi:MAG: hypothetical protein IKP61_03365 [Spirochaetales bacterium]|nr:hypothetical protein [Spirochaetales bacterium]